ncbi:ribonuclease H-like domain-containing protein [Mycena capillaripes]|nr:ribonuclease H-like domain-containing protein [Mycena capillaripes]
MGSQQESHRRQSKEDETHTEALSQFPSTHTVIYITTESQANDALRGITDGKVGIDTEFTDRRPTIEEHTIIHTFPPGGIRKSALLGWQIVELAKYHNFPIAWDNIGLRLVQIANDDVAWVLDMWKIRAFPKELRRILLSDKIKKVGVGLIKDISVLWDDLRTEMRNLTDSGMMARLMLVEKYPKQAYTNLALKTSVEDVLGFTIDKDLGQSDWSASKLSDEQLEYAALDAIASLKLHDVLVDSLARKSRQIKAQIPEGWYTFNTRMGEPTRTQLAEDGSEIAWKTSDCTWYTGGRFQSYYPLKEREYQGREEGRGSTADSTIVASTKRAENVK